MKKLFNTTTVFVILLAAFMVSGTAQAGNTAAKLKRAGYACFNDGPSNWTHCWIESKIGNQVIPIKVFSEDGTEFLGTELLLRDDVYRGQPCPQDGLALWEFLDFGDGLGYFACHAFYTGHHG
jgi:hypothetical protein